MEKAKIYKRNRFPLVIIQYAVWLYYRFNLSHRRCVGPFIEDLLAGRGINVSYEAIRLWCNRFGPKYAARLKRNHRGYVAGAWMRRSGAPGSDHLSHRGGSQGRAQSVRLKRLLLAPCRHCRPVNSVITLIQQAKYPVSPCMRACQSGRMNARNWGVCVDTLPYMDVGYLGTFTPAAARQYRKGACR
jgi:hypothetical protein